MFRKIVVLALAAAGFAAPRPTLAQDSVNTTAAGETPSVVRRSLSGPRFGFTVFTGQIADARSRAGLEPIMSQFGWQIEKRIVSSQDGNEALLEWIFLVGGVEQSEVNLTVSWLAGLRTASGLEVGAGPAISGNKDRAGLNTSMIIAAGATPPFGSVRLPIHFAVSMSQGGPRFTTLVGWVVD